MKGTGFNDLIANLRQTLAELPDRRKGKNLSYEMEAFGLSAFSVFFTQCPSFLAFQTARQETQGENNATTLFQIAKIPSDNQIRQMLDPVEPQALYPVYDQVYETLRERGILDTWRGVHDSTLIALDGTWYHSSQKIHCPCCSHLKHQNGEITYSHSAVTPVIVAPGKSEVFALRPEFITPQDGHTKQDCEIAASKRWLEENSPRYLFGTVTLLGDDLYAHQPFCLQTLLLAWPWNVLGTKLGFTDVTPQSIASIAPFLGVDVADFDNDGLLDIAFAGDETILLHNLGSNQFKRVSTSFMESRGGGVAWGDYDNDGYADLITWGMAAGRTPRRFPLRPVLACRRWQTWITMAIWTWC